MSRVSRGCLALLLSVAMSGLGMSGLAIAVEFRSVETATVLYDAPSQKGKPLYVIKRYTPVEIVVSLEGWAKVRDAEGGLAWIEKKHLSEQRTVIVVSSQDGFMSFVSIKEQVLGERIIKETPQEAPQEEKVKVQNFSFSTVS